MAKVINLITAKEFADYVIKNMMTVARLLDMLERVMGAQQFDEAMAKAINMLSPEEQETIEELSRELAEAAGEAQTDKGGS